MISQQYVPALETAFNALYHAGILDKDTFCDVLDRALFATRCPGQNYNANNGAGRRPHVGLYCRSNMADQGRLQGNTAGLTKEHVVPESVLWNLFRVGTPTGRLPNEGPPPPRTPVSVIAALYNVAFITQGTPPEHGENQQLDNVGLRSSMPQWWEAPLNLEDVTNEVAWARYQAAGLFDQMIRVADYIGDWYRPPGP